MSGARHDVELDHRCKAALDHGTFPHHFRRSIPVWLLAVCELGQRNNQGTPHLSENFGA